MLAANFEREIEHEKRIVYNKFSAPNDSKHFKDPLIINSFFFSHNVSEIYLHFVSYNL
jgi:hypothetical protein